MRLSTLLLLLLPTFLFANIASADLNDGLIVHYEFEGNANDSSGKGNHGKESGGVSFTSGVIGQAASFDGIDDIIQTGIKPQNINNTYSFWVKPETVDYGSGYSGAVVHQWGDAAEGYASFGFSLQKEKSVLNVYTGQINKDSYAPLLKNNMWQHIAIQFTGDNRKIYFNGSKVLDEIIEGPQASTIYDVQLGYPNQPYYVWKHFNGQLDDFRIYNRTLSESDIQELYTLENPVQSNLNLNDGLVAHYEFEANANDSSGNGNHGTEYGGLSYTNGMVGQAASFDGINDYIEVPDSNSLEFSNSISINSWVKISSDTGTGQRIVAKWTTGSSNNPDLNEFFLGYDSSPAGGHVNDAYYGGFDSKRLNTVFEHNLIYGKWHLATFTYDGSSSRLYLDGQLLDEQSVTLDIPNGTAPMFIGGGASGSPMPIYIFNGLIDDLRIYNRALSSSEIQQLYQLKNEDNSNSSVVYSSEKNHYYEFVDEKVSWTEAKAFAESKTYNGMQGYLVTITSPEEDEFISSLISQSVWIGATDREIEGEWRWATGPEAGTQFWQGDGNGSIVNGQYSNFLAPNQPAPSNYSSEDYANKVFNNVNYPSNQWADGINRTRLAYVIEYGNDPDNSDNNSNDDPVNQGNQDVETVLNWAEELYPNLFPSAQPTKSSGGSFYREYPESGIRVTASNDGKVYLMGREFGPNQSYVGELDFFFSQATKAKARRFIWNSGSVYGSFESSTGEYDHNFAGFLARYLNTFNEKDKSETKLRKFNQLGEARSYSAVKQSIPFSSGGIKNIQFHIATQFDTTNSQPILLLMFEGSKELSDWANDIEFQETNFRNSQINTHRGISRIFDLFIDDVLVDPNITVSNDQPVTLSSYFNAVKNGAFQPKVIIAGHSLGGALATMMAAYLEKNGFNKDHLQVYTWGAPPIGKSNFVNAYSDLSVHNIINDKDVVPFTTQLCGDYGVTGDERHFSGTFGSFDWGNFNAGCSGLEIAGVQSLINSFDITSKLLDLGPSIISRDSHSLYCSYIKDYHPEWYEPSSSCEPNFTGNWVIETKSSTYAGCTGTIQDINLIQTGSTITGGTNLYNSTSCFGGNNGQITYINLIGSDLSITATGGGTTMQLSGEVVEDFDNISGNYNWSYGGDSGTFVMRRQ